MKILVISNLYPDLKNKTRGLYVKRITDNLITQGKTKVDLVLYSPSRTNFFLKVYRFLYFHLSVFRYVMLTKKKYDLIHVHFATHSTIVLIIFRRFIKSKIALNVHGGDVIFNTRTTALLHPIAKQAAKISDLIISPSYYFKNVVAETFGVNLNKIIISPSGGIDKEYFRPQEEKSLNISFTISYISRFIPEKGWGILCESLSILKSENRQIKCYFCGSGNPEFVVELIRKHSLEDVAVLVEDPDHSEFLKILHQSDVFVFPTMLKESLGLVALEALSAGVPVIASNIGAIPEYIQQNKNGVLVNPGDSRAFSTEIDRLIDNPERLNEMAKEAVRSTDHFDQKKVTDSLINDFNEIINT